MREPAGLRSPRKEMSHENQNAIFDDCYASSRVGTRTDAVGIYQHGIDHSFGRSAERLRRKTRNLTGGPKGKMLLHKKTIDDVLEQLKAGQTVDPRKIEKALEVHGS